MVKELNEKGKLMMKILKMMSKNIEIQIRKTCFYQKENEFMFSTNSIKFNYVEISKSSERTLRLCTMDIISGTTNEVIDYQKWLIVRIPRRQNLSSIDDEISKNRKFFFLFLSSSILSRWNCFRKSQEKPCSNFVMSITLIYMITNFEDDENFWKDHLRRKKF